MSLILSFGAKTVLLLLVIVFGSEKRVKATDMFTSMNDIEKGLMTQKTLANDLKTYIGKEIERITQLQRIANELEKYSTESLSSGDAYLSNPVNAYLLIKKFSLEWNDNVRDYVNNRNTDAFLQHLTEWGGSLPNKDDLFGSAMALLRLQDVYALPTSKMAHGLINEASQSATMTADDCFQLGTIAYFRDDHYHAVLWLTEALKIDSEEKEKTTSRSQILDFLSFSIWKQGNVLHAYNLTLEWLQLEPGHERALNNLRSYEATIRGDEALLRLAANPSETPPLRNQRKKDDYRSTEEYDNYERLCRGEKTQEIPNSHLLTCQFRRHHPMFYINPLREEVIHLSPRVVLYHEIATNAEIDRIKAVATPKLHRSGVFQLTENDNPFTEYRTSKSAWVATEEDSEGFLASLNRKAMALSNLTLDTAELLQVLNYGIGGQYEPHHDFARPNEIYTFEEWRGNRIATVMYYLSDVEAGGGTAFNLIGLQAPAKKGSCILWYNLMLNGEGDYRTKHAGCPVLIGNKWVVTKWFHSNGQEFIRPCALSPEQ